MQFAWARQEQDLKGFSGRSHGAGCKVTHMAGAVPEALRAAKAGADIIIAQGTEGGGHVGRMASMPVILMVVDAVAPIPVLAAGGFVPTGAGLWLARHSVPRAYSLERAFSQLRNRRPTSSRRLLTATAMTPSFLKFPTLRPGRSGREPFHRALGWA
jgi:hypothetical protein